MQGLTPALRDGHRQVL